MMNSTGNQRELFNSSWHVDQGLTLLDRHTPTHTHTLNVYSTKLVDHGDQHAWSFTSSSSSYTIWSPFVTAGTAECVWVCLHVSEYVFVCLRSCMPNAYLCVCVSWGLALHWGHVAWESENYAEPHTPKHPQLYLNSAALFLHALLVKPPENSLKCTLLVQHDLNPHWKSK